MTIFLTGLLTCLALIVAIGAQSLFIMRQAIRRDRLLLTLTVCLIGDVILILGGTAGVGALTESAPWVIDVLTWGGVAYLLWFAASSFRSAFSTRKSLSVQAEEDGAEGTGTPGHDGGAPAHADGSRPAGDGPGEPVLVGAGAGVGPSRSSGPATGTLTVVSARERLSVRLERNRARSAQAGRAQSTVLAVVIGALSVSLLNPHAILDTVVMLGTIANSHGEAKWVFAGGALVGSLLWFLTLGFGVRALAPLLDTPRTWKIVDIVVGCIMLGIAGTLAFS